MTAHTGAPWREKDDQATRLRSMLGAADRLEDGLPPELHAPPIITVASGKGGVGKSILALSIAASLADDRRVTLLDADFGAANADVLLGMAPLRRLDECLVTDFAPGRRPLDIALDVAPNLRLIPGIVGGRALPDAGQRRRLVDRLVDFHTSADTIVIDAAAGVHPAVIDMLAAADCPLIVTTPEPTAVADAYALLKSLALNHGTDVAARACIAVNLADDRAAADRVYRRLAAVSERFLGIRPMAAGIIPRDSKLTKAVLSQRVAVIRQRARLRRAIDSVARHAAAAAIEAQSLRMPGR